MTSTTFGDQLAATVVPFRKTTPPTRPAPRDPSPLRPAALLNERLAKAAKPGGRDAVVKAFVDARRTLVAPELAKRDAQIAELQRQLAALEALLPGTRRA